MGPLDRDPALSGLQAALERVADSVPDVRWSMVLLRDGRPIAAVDPERVLATASMGKVFLLLDVARAMLRGELAPEDRLTPTRDEAVADSGLWQHLAEPSLSVASLCVLVGAVSDNLATNVLLRARGLESVQEISRELGYDRTLLLDRIRDERTPSDAPAPSQGSAGDLADLMHRIAQGTALGEPDELVRNWLALNTDLSMVAAAFALDPLAHGRLAGDPWLISKTGTDHSVRADAGCLVTPSSTWAYAVVANGTPGEANSDDDIMRGMRLIGEAWRAAVDEQG